MPQVSAAVLRSTPSSTSASASIRRAAALSFSPLAALRSSEAVRSSRVIDTAAPIDAAPLKGQHRVRVSLIWESLMSHSFGPLVLLEKLLKWRPQWTVSEGHVSGGPLHEENYARIRAAPLAYDPFLSDVLKRASKIAVTRRGNNGHRCRVSDRSELWRLSECPIRARSGRSRVLFEARLVDSSSSGNRTILA